MLPFICPTTGEKFGEVRMHTPDEVHQALRELRQAAPLWQAKSVQERARILLLFLERVLDSLDDITATLNKDCGKTRQDALIEVFITADMLRQYARHAPQWLRTQRVVRGMYLFKKTYVAYKPYGVVGVIAPWNYPFALSIPPVIAALLAGNTVALKPSEATAASGVMMDELFRQVPELAPFVRVLHGDAAVGAALVEARPNYIFLTGSTPTGRAVMRAAAEHLIPVACELGGKDAMIVLEDADLPAAALWGVWGANFNSGQTCMAVERVYVDASVYDEFVRLAVDETNKLRMGYTDERESPYHLGPITDPRQLKIIQRHLEDALEKGARLLTGGQIQGSYVTPGVLVDVTHDMLIMQEETFGPIMPIMKVANEEEAIEKANDCRFGLGAAVWSDDLARAQRVAHRLEASSIVINDTIAQFGVPMLPFGGTKDTGTGRIHGREGLMQFVLPYAYAVGKPPYEWDIATILRKPGHYRAASVLTRVLFGVSPRQRLEPLQEEWNRLDIPISLDRARKMAAGLGVFGALLAGAFTLTRALGKPRHHE
ncbi:MAG: aldehyde dehydrogenase family protein [Anaerolineales bacterium]